MKKILLITLCGLFTCTLHAQITTDERPYGLNVTASASASARVNGQNVITLSAPNRAVIAQEDLINDSQPGPVRYAYPVDVNYTLENSGVWQELNDGSKIWRLKVKLPGALSTNTMYDKFWLPDGTKFSVYSEDTEQYIGAITSEYIEGSRENPIEFATAIIYGETVVFEYFQPASVSNSAVISISRIDYGYRYVDNPYGNMLQNFGDAASCNININCSEGSNWQTEKHAVARVGIVGPNGSGWCSCALVNNTDKNDTPYVLTANHCLSGLDAISNSSASQCIFYWEYEHPGCANSTTQPTIRSTTGATVVANNSSSDFALFRLTQNPLNVLGVTPYYLGWNRSGSAGTSGVGIHHPRGDVKKISVTNQIQNDTEWKVVWSSGTTEGGSSGSPLINNDRKIIGQLRGGDASCSSLSSPDYYGKFNVSWTGNGATDDRRKLQPWLDPAGTNPTTLNGKGPLSISGSSFVCSGSSSTFTANNEPRSYTWGKSSNLTLSSTSGNTATFTANGNGPAWVSILINGTEVKRKTVYAGKLQTSDFSGSCGGPETGSTGLFTGSALSSYSVSEFEWGVAPGWTVVSHPNFPSSIPMGNVRITRTNSDAPTTTPVWIRARNSCGWSNEKALGTLSSSSVYTMSAYPNPVSDVLNVLIEEDEEALMVLSETTDSSASSVGRAKPVYSIGLYNLTTGTPVLQTSTNETGTVQLNVGNLPNGIYVLRVHDGTENPPLTQRIVISH